jgi:hypothetical protein
MQTVFLSLAALACPIGMGAMMWFMGRGMRRKPEDSGPPPSLDALRDEQRRLSSEIERLQDEDSLTSTRR